MLPTSAVKKSRNVNIDMAKEDIISDKRILCIIGIANQTPCSVLAKSSVIYVVDGILAYELLANTMIYVAELSVIILFIDLAKMMAIYVEFGEHYIFNAYFFHA